MKKAHILSLVTISSLALTPVVGANETTSSSTEQVAPIDEATLPSLPTETIAPTAPITEDLPTLPETVTEVSAEPQPTESVEPTQPTIPDLPPTPEEPATHTETTPVPEEPVVSIPETESTSPETVPQAQEQPVTTQDQATEAPSTVILEQPLETVAGFTVIGAQDRQLLVSQEDGQAILVAPEAVGAVVNADQTITLTTQEGEVKTLPRTGDSDSLFYSLLGVLTTTSTGLFHLITKKKQA